VVASENGAPLTEAIFRARVQALAAELKASSARSVALYHADAGAFAVLLLACWQAGCEAVLAADDRPATAAALGAEVDLLIGEWSSPPESRPVAARPSSARVRSGPEEVVLSVFTSGSTGSPVRIAKTEAQLRAEVAAIDALLQGVIPGGESVAGTVSHQHFYGLLFRVLWPLATSRRIEGRMLRYPEELASLPAHPPRVLISSPAFLKYFGPGGSLLSPGSQWRLVVSAGSALGRDVAGAITASSALALCEIYGSSETGAVAARWGIEPDWTPLPGVAIRVSPDERLMIRAPQLGSGGWQVTADLAKVTAAGFALAGRADRIAKIADKRVSLDQVEAALGLSPLVRDVRVVPIPGDPAELGAVIVLAPRGDEALQERGSFALGRQLRRELAGQFEAVVLPRRFRFVAALPVDLMGKVRAEDLVDLFRSRQCRPAVTARRRDGESCVLSLHVDGALECFLGHFPGYPVVPGVMQMEWAIAFAREEFALASEFRGVDALKFHHTIAPDTPLKLTLVCRDPGELNFRYESNRLHSAGRILFGAGTP
jgi:acyl-CoA synthetase (AMP-forming)/AMP-acid ligase II/3-hydroxymyristoyl/3-hydroxydecanoyl-(acyl carrier protein) dehydratase